MVCCGVVVAAGLVWWCWLVWCGLVLVLGVVFGGWVNVNVNVNGARLPGPPGRLCSAHALLPSAGPGARFSALLAFLASITLGNSEHAL